jgi:alpha-L-fucosidase
MAPLRRCYVSILALAFAGQAVSGEEQGKVTIARPTPQQAAWQDMEVGLFIHFNMFTCAPDWTWRSFKDYPSPDLFNPTKLDTDQWMRAAKGIGAKYAVLTVKHCEGFCLWPTEAYPYSVKQSTWRDGKGDVAGDFVRSCRTFGIRPGFYYSTSANAYCKVDDPGRVRSKDPADQARYKAICEQQLAELWSRYGELGEIWFDGGSLPPEQGGADIGPLIRKYQPNAVVFQSPHATIRWVGNEDGVAPYPCWATAKNREPTGGGDPDGQFWRPGECDVPLRGGEWGWKPNQEHLIRSMENLTELYCKSVGRNCNLLLNSTPDRSGLIPEPDMKRYIEFGAEIGRRFGKPLGETRGEGDVVELTLDKPTLVDHVVIMEQISEGERVREYVVEGLASDGWKELCRGVSIGHKRIDRCEPLEVSRVRLRCLRSVAKPLIRQLAVFQAEPPPAPLVDHRWSADEKVGNGLRDWLGSNPGQVHGAKRVAGPTRYALEFDGKSSYVGLGRLDVLGHDFTLAAWVCPSAGSGTGRVIVGKERSGVSANQMRLYLGPENQLGFTLSDGAGNELWPFETAAGSVPAGKWSQVAVTRRGREFTLYVNGKASGTKLSGAVIRHRNSEEMRIGARHAPAGDGPDSVFQGRIGEVRLGCRALSPAELSAASAPVEGRR